MATVADVLRRAAALAEANPDVHPDAAIALRWAAAHLTGTGEAAYALSDDAIRLLADHLRYGRDIDPARALAQWSRIRTPGEITDRMRRAADAADGLPERGGPLPGQAAEDALLDEFEARQARPDVRGGPPIGDGAEADYDRERES